MSLRCDMVVITKCSPQRACQVRAPLLHYLADTEYQHLRFPLLTGVEFECGFPAGCGTMAKDLPCASVSPSIKKGGGDAECSFED